MQDYVQRRKTLDHTIPISSDHITILTDYLCQMQSDAKWWVALKSIQGYKNNVINHRPLLPSSGIMMINSPRWRPSTTMKSSMIKTKVWSRNIDNNWRSGCHSDSHTTIHHHILRKCWFFCMLTKEKYHKQYHSPWLMDFMKISSFDIPPNKSLNGLIWSTNMRLACTSLKGSHVCLHGQKKVIVEEILFGKWKVNQENKNDHLQEYQVITCWAH